MRPDSMHMRFVLLLGAMCLSAQDTVIRTSVPLILVPGESSLVEIEKSNDGGSLLDRLRRIFGLRTARNPLGQSK